jgi:ABC-type glucose/galactose transport system permease subunit
LCSLLLNSNFFSLRNATNVLQQAAVLTVLALGETFVVTMGSIDLSIGSTVSMVGMLAALLIRDHGEWAVLAAPLAGAAVGAINGVLAAYAKLPSFLITLGMLFAVNGMTLYLTQGTAIGVQPDLQIQSVFNGFCLGRRRSHSGRWRPGCFPFSQRAEHGSDATFMQSAAVRPWPSCAAFRLRGSSFTRSSYAGFSLDSLRSCSCCV